MPNITDKLAIKLEQAGIKSDQELKILGAEKSFLLLLEVDPKAKLEHLYILEAAIEGIDVSKLSEVKKEELKMFYDICK